MELKTKEEISGISHFPAIQISHDTRARIELARFTEEHDGRTTRTPTTTIIVVYFVFYLFS